MEAPRRGEAGATTAAPARPTPHLFVQPLAPHEHWHIDIAYLNVAGTFYYLCSILDGASRAIVHWDIRESMTEQEIIL